MTPFAPNGLPAVSRNATPFQKCQFQDHLKHQASSRAYQSNEQLTSKHDISQLEDIAEHIDKAESEDQGNSRKKEEPRGAWEFPLPIHLRQQGDGRLREQPIRPKE